MSRSPPSIRRTRGSGARASCATCSMNARGCPTLQVTHDFEDATALADRVGVIVAGTLRQVGTPERLLRRPEDAFVARFVGANLLPGVARALGDGFSEVTLEQGGLIRALAGPDGPVGAVVHPWDVTVEISDGHDPALNLLRAPIASIAPVGNRVAFASGPSWPSCPSTTPVAAGWRRAWWPRPGSRPRPPGWCPSAPDQGDAGNRITARRRASLPHWRPLNARRGAWAGG